MFLPSRCKKKYVVTHMSSETMQIAPQKSASSKALNVSLWIVQGLGAVAFLGGAVWKVATPVEELAKQMPWMGEVSPGFLIMTAIFDFLGGVGIILPSMTRVQPKLAPLAALGGIALMLAAITFHLSRGEAADTPFNFFMIALLTFVYWGRTRKSPISSRA